MYRKPNLSIQMTAFGALLIKKNHAKYQKNPVENHTSSRERDPQSGASGGRLVLGVLELLSTINIVELEENGVAIGAFDFESGNFLRI